MTSRRSRAAQRSRTGRHAAALASIAAATALVPPAASWLFVLISGSAMSDDLKGMLYSVTGSGCALVLFVLLAWTNSVRGRDDLISWAGLVVFLLAAFVIGLPAYAVNEHKLAVYGRTEQVTVTSASREAQEAGSEDNPVDYFTYNYVVTDTRGKRVNGEIHTDLRKQEFRVGQRITATVDPRGRLDPVLGRPGGTGVYVWLAVAAEAAVAALAIANAFPDLQERSDKAWDAALRAMWSGRGR